MIKIIKDSYLLIILFIILLLKEPIYNLFIIEENIYNTMQCSILESDYNKLLEFSEIDYIYDSKYINTLIIYKDIYDYMNKITIRGGIDKNFKNNAVVYDNTLTGVIEKTNKNSSIVKLITNNSSKISVSINDEVGIVEYKNGNLRVSNISNYSNIKLGDQIFTSGLGNIKENIFIGQVKEITLDNKNIEKIIKVDYKIDIKDIDYVTVIMENL